MAAVEDAVQVGREDLPLRQAVGELVRQARLLQLARERALVAADVEVADKLLRDRRAAFDDPAGLETRQVLRFAARAIELSGAGALEEEFLSRLEAVGSNDPEAGDGRRIYQTSVNHKSPITNHQSFDRIGLL